MTAFRPARRILAVAILACSLPLAACGGKDRTGPAEKASYEVILLDPGPRKDDVIRLVVHARRLGPNEARDLVERRPPTTVKAGLTMEDAEALRQRLTEAGARAEVR